MKLKGKKLKEICNLITFPPVKTCFHYLVYFSPGFVIYSQMHNVYSTQSCDIRNILHVHDMTENEKKQEIRC